MEGEAEPSGAEEVPNGSLGVGAGEVIVGGGGEVTVGVAGFGDGGVQGQSLWLFCICRL